jgi:hypothetical protein
MTRIRIIRFSFYPGDQHEKKPLPLHVFPPSGATKGNLYFSSRPNRRTTEWAKGILPHASFGAFMSLCRVVYISDRSEILNDEELISIMEASRERNAALGISGLLLSGGGHFIQVLEGNPMHVHSLYRKIAADRRHQNVKCILDKSVTGRLFPDWGMKLGDLRQAVLDRQRFENALIRLRLTADENDALALLSEFRSQMMSQAA